MGDLAGRFHDAGLLDVAIIQFGVAQNTRLLVMPFPLSELPNDPGFSFRRLKNGGVEVLHHGRVAATLRGRAATEFLAGVVDPGSPDAQQLMARWTGNYKRGNERVAGSHPRNRKQELI